VARKWACEFLISDRVFKKSVINNLFDIGTSDIAEDLGVTVDFLKFRYRVWERKFGQ